MHKVTMSRVAHTDAAGTKVPGDSVRACLASILELPIDALPDILFTDILRRREIMHDLGYVLTRFIPNHDREQTPQALHLMIGKRFGGEAHCVVGLGGEILWDPHPEARVIPIFDVHSFWFLIAVEPKPRKPDPTLFSFGIRPLVESVVNQSSVSVKHGE